MLEITKTVKSEKNILTACSHKFGECMYTVNMVEIPVALFCSFVYTTV